MIQADTVALVELSQLRERWAERFSWDALAATGLQVLGALVVGFLAYALLVLVLRRVERAIGTPTPGVISAQEQRARTLLSLMRSVGLVLIVLATIVMVLGALGVNVGPLLAGAGVIGLAIGFGAQTLVKDVITGIFLLLENAMQVGDWVTLGGLSALFLLARGTVPFTVVYRRHNLAACAAVALFCAGAYLWGWSGLGAFIAGTLSGGWRWLGQIRRTNALLGSTRSLLASPRSYRARSVRSTGALRRVART